MSAIGRIFGIGAKAKNVAKYNFDYSKVLHFAEGQVRTRSGKVYTRTVLGDGRRVYRGADGVVCEFKSETMRDHFIISNSGYMTKWNPSTRTAYSLKVDTWRHRGTEASRETSHWPLGEYGTTRRDHFEITSDGRLTRRSIERVGAPGTPENRSEWNYCNQCPSNIPVWTSLSDYVR